MKKKILFVIPNLKSGGAEKVVTSIINLLSKNDKYEIILLLMNHDNLFYKDYLDDNIIIDFLGYKRALDFFIKPRIFYNKIFFYSPNYIFSGYGEINPFVAFFSLFFLKITFIARETSIPSLRVKKLYSKVLYFLTYRLFDKIIVQSIAMQEDLINKFYLPRKKILLIHNPIDNFLIEKISKKHSKFLVEIDEEILLLYIGTINKNKNVDKIIEFYTNIRDKGVNGSLMILGSGPEDCTINNLIEQNIYRKSIFKVSENISAPLYLKHSKYLIIASDYEGFPNVALEASYFGVPVILSKNTQGGAREFIVPNVNGIVLDLGNPDLEFLNHIFDKEEIKKVLMSRHSCDIFLNSLTRIFI